LLEWYKKTLTKEQRDEIYEATKGIPIVIKHCLGQLFEFCKPISQVIRDLSSYHSDIVQFSHKEILDLIESEEDKSRLSILILLELGNQPLTIDQLSQILSLSKLVTEEGIAQLSRFQCVQTIYQSGVEKYQLNPEIRNLTCALRINHEQLVYELRKSMCSRVGDLEFNASQEEIIAAQIFDSYIQQGSPSEALEFINNRLPQYMPSILLGVICASFLIDQRKPNEAIEILEAIREPSNNDRRVLSLLLKANGKLSTPAYEKMETYAVSLETWIRSDREILRNVASFYRDWAIWMKSSAPPVTPHDKYLKIQRYKELAQKGLDIIHQINRNERTHIDYFIIAQCKFCKWDYEKSLEAISLAINLTPSSGIKAEYNQFYNTVNLDKLKFAQP
jgi:tetratricopeptide (TPR) repeat protein